MRGRPAEGRCKCVTKEQLGNLILASEKQMYATAKSILKQDADCADAIQERCSRRGRKVDEKPAILYQEGGWGEYAGRSCGDRRGQPEAGACANNGDQELHNVLYQGNLLLLKEQGSEYRIYTYYDTEGLCDIAGGGTWGESGQAYDDIVQSGAAWSQKY